MIDIYMYTNKLNNKKYVGQLINRVKRFDQHFKSNQLIDNIIQLEGIENFNFEILKQVDKPNLSTSLFLFNVYGNLCCKV